MDPCYTVQVSYLIPTCSWNVHLITSSLKHNIGLQTGSFEVLGSSVKRSIAPSHERGCAKSTMATFCLVMCLSILVHGFHTNHHGRRAGPISASTEAGRRCVGVAHPLPENQSLTQIPFYSATSFKLPADRACSFRTIRYPMSIQHLFRISRTEVMDM